MTGKLEGISVIFEKPIREEDAEKTIEAILQLRGVLEVKAVISPSDTMLADAREIYKIHKKLLDFLTPVSFDPHKKL